VNEDREDPLNSTQGKGIEEAGVWIRDTLARAESGFYHLGYSSARPGKWEGIEELLDSTHLEEFRLVAEGLRAQAGTEEGLVTVVGDDQSSARARTYLAFQVARLLAQGGGRVLLVDGEFEEDGPGEWLGDAGREGLLDVARYGASPGATLQSVGLENVDLMGVGSYRPRESEPLSPEELRGALRQLKAVWNFILITAPARNAQGEYNPLFSHGDGVLMGLTLKGEARDRFEALAEALMERSVVIFGVMAFPEAASEELAATPEAESELPRETKVRHVSSSPYARDPHPHQSSALFRRIALGIGLILVVFVGVWATIQWSQRPRVESGSSDSGRRESLAATKARPANSPAAVVTDSSATQDGEMAVAMADSVPPDSLKSAILTPEKEEEEIGANETSSSAKPSPPAPELSDAETESVGGPLAVALRLRPENGYALHPWSFPDSTQTLPSLRKLRAAGMQPVVVSAEIPGKGTWYRVIVGNYPTRQAALKARSLLLTRPDVDYVGIVRVGH
jgi:septal ring-binding cell division protein DamX